MNKLHIFVADKENNFPLYTDELSEMENLKEAIKNDGEIWGDIIKAIGMFLICGLMIDMSWLEFNPLISYIFVVIFTSFFVIGLIILPIFIVSCYSYQICVMGINLTGWTNEARWPIVMFAISVTSVPILAVATYLLFLYPKNAKIKALSYIDYTLYYITLWAFIKYIY